MRSASPLCCRQGRTARGNRGAVTELATCRSLQGGGPLTSTGRRSRPRPGASKQARNPSEQAASVTKSRSSLDASRTPRSVTQSVTPSVISQPSRAVLPCPSHLLGARCGPECLPSRSHTRNMEKARRAGRDLDLGTRFAVAKATHQTSSAAPGDSTNALLLSSQGARSSAKPAGQWAVGSGGLTSPLNSPWAGPPRPH